MAADVFQLSTANGTISMRILLMTITVLIALGGCAGKKFTTYDYPRPVNPENVRIARDAFGAPHVIGKTDADTAYGLAWATAEDNNELGQRTFMIVRARYAEYAGKDAALYDYLVHALDAEKTVREKYESDISPEFKRYLEAFTQGLNDFALTHPDEILLDDLFPVTPQDVIRGHLILHSVDAGLLPEIQDILEGRLKRKQSPDTGRGSNGFAFAPGKTEDGRTYLVLNPHLPIEDLFSLYEAHLYSEEGLNIIGGMNAMSPCLPNGVNENLGWMIPTSGTDGIDVYELEINPENEKEYRFDDEWRKLQEREIEIRVKLSPGLTVPVKRKVYKSVYGPTFITDHGAFSIRTGTLMNVKLAEQLYRMDKAKNLEEFLKALRMGALARKNVIYADRVGNILFQSVGLVPKRKPGFDWSGVLPGNTYETLWTEFHPIDDLVSYLNPACGYVYNTNNSPFQSSCPEAARRPEDYPSTLTFMQGQNNRARRAEELMDAFGDKIAWEELHRLKYDRRLPVDHSFAPLFERMRALDLSGEPKLKAVADRLLAWDLRAETDSKGAALFFLLSYELYKRYERKIPSRNPLILEEGPLMSVLKAVRRHIDKTPKGIDSRLGDLFVHQRGDVSLPFGGHRDTLAAAFGPPAKDGRFRYMFGDGYVLFAAFGPDGLTIETSNAYGASGDPDSPHYTDQMKLAAERKTRPMTLDIKKVLAEAVRIYHPGRGVEATLKKHKEKAAK